MREAGSGEGFVVAGAFWKTGQRRTMVWMREVGQRRRIGGGDGDKQEGWDGALLGDCCFEESADTEQG